MKNETIENEKFNRPFCIFAFALPVFAQKNKTEKSMNSKNSNVFLPSKSPFDLVCGYNF